MSNFQIAFAHSWQPWLFLLLIPALFFTLFPYFRLNKKYRRTRNRVTSMILHMFIMLFAVTVLAGMTFAYDVPNRENEVMFLVDVSFSGNDQAEARDEFLRDAIRRNEKSFKLGIVTFGYTQVYAAPLTSNTSKLLEQYHSAEKPDVSATDIAAALSYTRNLFEHPETAKIVLLSDGAETDGKAASVIRSVAADGIRVDTVYFANERGREVALLSVETPDYNIAVGDDFNLSLTLRSNYAGEARVSLYDNGEQVGEGQMVDLTNGIQTIAVPHSFSVPGMHELSFKIESERDTLLQNNTYYTYINLGNYNNILILERRADESADVQSILLGDAYKAGNSYTEGSEYTVTVVNINDLDKVPTTALGMCEYDEIMLFNIGYYDMPAGFEEALESYVHDYGGGLFTVGGDREDGTPNAYNYEEMYGTTYWEMLPVAVGKYTPPVAVMFLIDTSGTMIGEDKSTGEKYYKLAAQAASQALDGLSDYDYAGVISLRDSYTIEARMSAMTPGGKQYLRRQLENLPEVGGGTVYRGAIEQAARALNALDGDNVSVARKHIILLSDCMSSDPLEDTDDEQGYGAAIQHNYQTSGITFSVIGINVTDETSESVNNVKIATGENYGHGSFTIATKGTDVATSVRNELQMQEIDDTVEKLFTPEFVASSPVLNRVDTSDLPSLRGIYSSRLRGDLGATAALTNEYKVPVYAQWKYGEGRVGSFMSRLSTEDNWGFDFVTRETGKHIVRNIVTGLLPTKDIRPQEIPITLSEGNYTTQLSIYTKFDEGDTIEITVTSPPASGSSEPVVQHKTLNAGDGYSRVTFETMQPGIHEIHVQRKNAAGEVVAEQRVYKTFSYSAEYDVFVSAEECRVLLEELAEGGKGAVVAKDDAGQVYENVVDTLHRTFDPRLLFIIAAIVLFLLDIAVRKFQFKWPHELIREYRAKKQAATES